MDWEEAVSVAEMDSVKDVTDALAVDTDTVSVDKIAVAVVATTVVTEVCEGADDAAVAELFVVTTVADRADDSVVTVDSRLFVAVAVTEDVTTVVENCSQ